MGDKMSRNICVSSDLDVDTLDWEFLSIIGLWQLFYFITNYVAASQWRTTITTSPANSSSETQPGQAGQGVQWPHLMWRVRTGTIFHLCNLEPSLPWPGPRPATRPRPLVGWSEVRRPLIGPDLRAGLAGRELGLVLEDSQPASLDQPPPAVLGRLWAAQPHWSWSWGWSWAGHILYTTVSVSPRCGAVRPQSGRHDTQSPEDHGKTENTRGTTDCRPPGCQILSNSVTRTYWLASIEFDRLGRLRWWLACLMIRTPPRPALVVTSQVSSLITSSAG